MRKGIQKVLEKAYEAGKATKEEVLDGVMAMGMAYMWGVGDWYEREAWYERAKEGFVRLLRVNHAKSVEATYQTLIRTTFGHHLVPELRPILERVKVSLPDTAVTYIVTNKLGEVLYTEKKFEEAKVLWLAALEGRRRVLGEEHKDSLFSLNYMWLVLNELKDYTGALDYYLQVPMVQEKVLGKTHPHTLTTMYNIASAYRDGLKDYTKAEEMYRIVLDGYEKPLGKDHWLTKKCAWNLSILLWRKLKSKEKTRALIKEYPVLLTDDGGLGKANQDALRDFIK